MSELHPGLGFHPLYLQVKERLIHRVLLGDWKPGEVLPSEMKLATEYKVSQGTVRKALEEMTAEHLVVRHQGKGTFVSGRATESPVHFFSIVNRGNLPVVAGLIGSLEWGDGPGNEHERKNLDLEEGAEVYRITRIRQVEGKPAFIEKISLSKARFPKLPDLLCGDQRMTTYLILERDYGVSVVRAEEWLEAVQADADDVARLKVMLGMPLLCITRISYAVDGHPVETRRIRFATGSLRYHTTHN
ncbi:MAG: GntR family transcriptional regulator [Alphaproteobacteria bacterium]|jgi:GntR family transcriptional regulator